LPVFDSGEAIALRLTTILLSLLTGLFPLTGAALSFQLQPGQEVVGALNSVETRYEDTFSDIARIYDVGYREMIAANPTVDAWVPGEGTEVVVPTSFVLPEGPHEGVVINLAELRLYYFPEGEDRVITFPLGIGREGWNTPTGNGRIVRKKEHPTWTPPESIRQEAREEGKELPPRVEPGPDNPLGDYALYLSIPGYLLHGTNKPYGVGMRVSHGCMRLYPEDIAELFPQVPVGTSIRIINQPYKVGWLGDRLYIESHPKLSEQRKSEDFNFTPLMTAITKAIGDRNIQVDWNMVKEISMEETGIPIPILHAPQAPEQTP
jgi:L,D-transpeptidase ErfK/SrfK